MGCSVNPRSRNLVRTHVAYQSVAVKGLSCLHESARLYETVTSPSTLNNRKLMLGYVLAISLTYQRPCGMTNVSRHLPGHGALNVGLLNPNLHSSDCRQRMRAYWKRNSPGCGTRKPP